MAKQNNRTRRRNNSRSNTRREQPRKDSPTKRVNFDNERESKFIRDERKAQWDKDSKAKDCNDVIWYAKNKMLLDSSASYNVSSSVGERVSMMATPTSTSGLENSVPGVMAIRYFPYLSGGAGDAIQRAKSDMYSFVVHANSRNQSYDDSDLMFVHIAGSQVFAAYALGVRAYGTMRKFAQEDQYTPEALISAMGFQYSDLKSNLSKMWFDLNELAARLQQIWIPNVTPVTERWYWLNTHIYRDGNSVKSQYYIFVPTLFYRFNETSEETGTSLDTYPWAPSLHTWEQYMTMMNSLIERLLNSQDRGIMFGDILKAYGANNLYAVTGVDANYVYEPVYNSEVLTQIENLTIWPIAAPTDVVQDDNGIISTRMTLSSAATGFYNLSSVLNFHQLQPPTPEQIMIATRLKTVGCVCQQVNESERRFAPKYAGTEVVSSVAVTSKFWLADGTSAYVSNTLALLGAPGTIDLFRWCAFDWAPWMYFCSAIPLPTTVGAEGTQPVQRPLGDWDNYTFLDAETLRKMHLTAVYSEFGVPSNLG